MNIDCEQRMERFRVVSGEDQVAREVLVVGVRLDEFVAGHRGEDRLPRNEPARQPDVDMVGPEEPPSADAILDESDRVGRKLPLRAQSRAPSDRKSVV